MGLFNGREKVIIKVDEDGVIVGISRLDRQLKTELSMDVPQKYRLDLSGLIKYLDRQFKVEVIVDKFDYR